MVNSSSSSSGTINVDQASTGTTTKPIWCVACTTSIATLRRAWTCFVIFYNSAVVTLTFLKLGVAIAISLSLSNWWTLNSAKDRNQIVESCANPNVGNCDSFCNDVSIINTTVISDDYRFDDDATGLPQVNTASHTTFSFSCVAEFRGSCAYDYWLLFKLVPIMFHLMGCLLQCLGWWYHKECAPQQRQYDTVIAYMYPSLYSDIERRKRQQEVTLTGNRWKDMRCMFAELMQRPFDSVYSFLEILTVVYVWGELWFPPIYCGSVRPLSLYYYPISMTLIDLTKFNAYIFTQLYAAKCYGSSVLALLNLDFFLCNLLITVCLSGVFIVGVLWDVMNRIRWYCVWWWYWLTGAGSKAWPTAVSADAAATAAAVRDNNNYNGSGGDIELANVGIPPTQQTEIEVAKEEATAVVPVMNPLIMTSAVIAAPPESNTVSAAASIGIGNIEQLPAVQEHEQDEC